MSVFDKEKKLEDTEKLLDETTTKIVERKSIETAFTPKTERKDETLSQDIVKEKAKEIKQLDKENKFQKVNRGKRKLKWNRNRKKKDKGTISEDGDFVPLNVVELEHRVDWSRISMWLSVFGIVAIVMIAQSIYMQSTAVMVILLIFGMGCFLPLGLVIGWLFMSIDMRCKILRMMRHKNYGIVHFVLRGGRHLTTRIMDLSGDVIVNEMRMWVIDKGGVHYIDRDGKKQFWAEITSDNIKTLPANIPCLYLDYETMVPLKFYKEQSDSNPLQVGSTHLGYIANQIAKMLFFKKTMTLFYIIIVVITALTLVVAMQEAMWLNDMKDQIPKIEKKMNTLTDMLNQIMMGNTTIPSQIPPPEG